MTDIGEIHDIFSIFHDGSIEGWSGNKDLLTLKISCQYLAERVDKSFDYFFIELFDINKIEFSTWPRDLDKPPEIITELSDIFKADLEICSADIENGNILITCNQSDTAHAYVGGILSINASSLKVYDQNKKELSHGFLAKICGDYWDDFGKPIPKINKCSKIFRSIPLLIFGGVLIYPQVTHTDQLSILDGVLFIPFLIFGLLSFLWALYRDSKEYRTTKSLLSYLATFTALILILLLFLVHFILCQKDRTPTLLFASTAGGLPGLFIEFRENGTYKIGNASQLGIDYSYGKYCFSDFLVLLDKTNPSFGLQSRTLIIRSGSGCAGRPGQDDDGNRSKIIYQVDRQGIEISQADKFIIREDKRQQ